MNEIDVLPVSGVRRVGILYSSFGVEGQKYQSVSVKYENGYGLNVIRGFGTYSSENTFEVAPILWTEEGDHGWTLIGKKMLGWPDDIRGWQSEEDLLKLERFMASLTTGRLWREDLRPTPQEQHQPSRSRRSPALGS